MISNVHAQKPASSFYVTWILLSAISAMIAFAAYFLLTRVINSIDGGWIIVNGQRRIAEDFLVPYLLWPMYALLYASLQYLMLRKYFPHMGWWIPATALGLPFSVLGLNLGNSIAAALNINFYALWMAPIQFMWLGGVIGAAQWFVLRGRVPRSIWWIPANLLGWGVIPLAQKVGIFVALSLPAIFTSITLYFFLTASPTFQEES
jgi:hypothetical protein